MQKDFFKIAFRVASGILLLIVVSYIFSNSLQVASKSTSASQSVTNKIQNVVNSVGIDKTIKESNVRVFAHFFEFFVLGISAFFFYFSFKRYGCYNIKISLVFHRFTLLFSFLFSVFIAIVDEVIQLFVDGRVFEIKDILVDTLGGFFGVVLSFFCCFWILKLVYTYRAKKIAKEESDYSL